ncbi:hypothetical protein TCA2_3420 [Paenibacillus sp. TCA20]|uniref:Uncharacterized protein n=1 Tax=Paenibacillus urinalis TaxID=521520 RepID=A0ABY7XCW9_9BACL|nr:MULTISPECIES: hypothetical protein [Paenibacillus]WDI03601.1 hypothetical protein PUW25_06490 [Paenibacillus urinalis]GAK40929.1 hypothetical protein TCA2_3420 [Paenibacillus sp. TCA20]
MSFNFYHYFDKDIGPFTNLSKLTIEEAEEVLKQIQRDGKTFASQRSSEYMNIRRELESTARDQFIAKGGKPRNHYPHYMTLESCEWISTWYKNSGVIVISSEEFLEESVSFTYGNLFPTMRFEDGKPYRKQVYTNNEIKEIIRQYGFPQEWNMKGDHGPERYIEVQVWDEEVIKRFLND